MKALLVTTDFPPAVGGIQASLYNTVCHFRHIEVIVVAPDHPNTQEFDRDQSFVIHRVKPPQPQSRSQRLSRYVHMGMESFRVVCREDVEVVLCGHPFTAPLGLAIKRLLKKPYVVWTHAKELLGWRYLLCCSLPSADAVLFHSAYTHGLASRLGVSMEKMVQIPCAPDCDSSLQEWVDDISYPANICLLLTVARMDDLYKGHDIMLRAMPLIAARVPHVRWVVVGDGKWRSYYEKMAHALGVQDRVHFLGTVSESERDKMLASCDVFVMVSRDRQIDGGGEGFGLVYLEANAFGKPVVAGRVAGALDAVVDGVTGLLVNPEDEFEVAEAVIALLTNPARAAQLGQQGRDRVQQNFTWDRTAAAVEEVLYKVARPISVQQ